VNTNWRSNELPTDLCEPRQTQSQPCTFTYHTWQFTIFTIFTITACIFSYSLSVSFRTQDLAFKQIVSSIDLFLSYRIEYTDSRTIWWFYTAQRLDLFAWCVRLSQLLVGFRTHFKSLHFHSFIHFSNDVATDLWLECRVDGCSDRICCQHLPVVVVVVVAAAVPLHSAKHNWILTDWMNAICNDGKIVRIILNVCAHYLGRIFSGAQNHLQEDLKSKSFSFEMILTSKLLWLILNH